MTKYNELQVSSHKDRKRVGRGISAGGGKTAGRGTKGQNASTGKKLRSMFQGGQNGIVSAVPKARGFKSLRTPAQVVYMDHLNSLKGTVVRLPAREEIDVPVEEHLIVELYSK